MWCPEEPMWARARSSRISLSLTCEPFIRYSLLPSRCTTLSIATSEKSRGKSLEELLNITLAEARFARASLPAPFHMRSSPRLPRMDFTDCSPRTKRKASATLDLPEPFGPTIAEIGELNSKTPFLAKDLNPESSMDFKYIS